MLSHSYANVVYMDVDGDIIMNCKKIIENVLDNHIIKKSNSFRGYVATRAFNFGGYSLEPVPDDPTINHIITSQVLEEYKLYDIQKTDIVLDIGAHVGAFSMLVCNSVKHVYAVEPLFYDILSKNIKNNSIQNITAFDIGLGLSSLECEFMSRKKTIKCISLSTIIEMCGGHVDFLKLDCEGGEWCILPEELNGIRRIECEVHSCNNKNMFDFVEMLKTLGYDIDVSDRTENTILIHANK